MDYVEKLINDLKDSNAEVRMQAALQIASVKGAKALLALPELFQALRSEDNRLRMQAVEALKNIGDTSAVPRLLDMLVNEPDRHSMLRWRVLESLEEIITKQNSIEKLDEIRRYLREFTAPDRDPSTYTHARKPISDLFILLNSRKNELLHFDIQPGVKFKPPKKPEGGIYRAKRVAA